MERKEEERYGTFLADSIHGRLFELQVYIESMKYHARVYFVFCIIAVLLWPIAWLLAVPVSLVAGKNRELQMFKVILTLATLIGVVIWFIPSIIIASKIAALGGVHESKQYFRELIHERQEVTYLDFVDFFLSELLILLIIVFSWVYHDIVLDSDNYIWSAKESWKQHSARYGSHLSFPVKQVKRLRRALATPETCRVLPVLRGMSEEAISPSAPFKCLSLKQMVSRSESSFSDGLAKDRRRSSPLSPLRRPLSPSSATRGIEEAAVESAGTIHEDSHHMSIVDVLTVLEMLPGWSSQCLDVADHLSELVGQEMGLYAELDRLHDEAAEDTLWPIDLWMVRAQFYPEVEIGLWVGFRVALYCAKDIMTIVFDYVSRHITLAVFIFILSVMRAILPRLWLWAVLGGSFWPADRFGTAGLLVLCTTCWTWLCSLFWTGLFFVLLLEYRRTVCQMTIVSALVDARTRVIYCQNFLLSNFWFGLSPEESEAALEKLPILDICTSSNAAAFWSIREYCILGRCRERMNVSVFIEIVVIWLFLKFLTTIVVMFVTHNLPAILIETLFDLLVFGSMTVFALHGALWINSMMDGHKQSFAEAKYMVTMEYGQHRFERDEFSVARKRDLDVARHLLTEYLDMTNEGDCNARDRILFGYVVTPVKILSSLATLTTMASALLLEMFANGALRAPEGFKEHLLPDAGKGLAFGVAHTAVTRITQQGFLHVD